MVFSSLTFLCFFAILWTSERLLRDWTQRKALLLVASYLFYAAWNPPFVLLIWISTAVDWIAARRMASAPSLGRRRAWLALSLIVNLGLLGYFKYAALAGQAFARLLAAVEIHYAPPELDIILPVGISFYTFQTLSYSIDVYRGRLKPWPSLLDFALFVTFFPQLVAGPIVRAAEFLPQCREPRRASGDQIGWGLTLLTIGLFQKTVLADAALAGVADTVFRAALHGPVSSAAAWLGTLAFSAQIFFDFSGYSLCAIGVGLTLGYRLPDNFKSPYGALGFADFWRRWHVSLSTWLRDYLYISLGGNRRGPWRTYLNLAITMLLGGLWHGAAWRFVAWGGMHGFYLIIERWLRSRFGHLAPRRWYTRAPLILLTYGLVCLTWVLFRAESLAGAHNLFAAMLLPDFGEPLGLEIRDAAALGVLLINAGLVATHVACRNLAPADLWRRIPWPGRAALLATALITLALVPGEDRAFIYFQF